MTGSKALDTEPQGQSRPRETRPKRRTAVLILGSLVVLAGIAAAVLLLVNNNGGAESQASGPLRNRQQIQYEINVPGTWPTDKEDERVGNYLETVWREPGSLTTTLVIDSRTSEEDDSPASTAELARVQLRQLPGYRERGMKGVRLGGHPAVRWAYNVAGKGHIDYFLAECGTSIVVRGTMPAVSFRLVSKRLRERAATIYIPCE